MLCNYLEKIMHVIITKLCLYETSFLKKNESVVFRIKINIYLH